MSNEKRGPGRPKKEKQDAQPRQRKTREEVIAEKRNMRAKMNDLRSSMEIGDGITEAGYMYRYVNDLPGRIEAYKARGWEMVEDPDKDAQTGEDVESSNNSLGNAISIHAGVDSSKKPYNAVLMRIEEELYHEGEAEKQMDIDKIDEALTRQDGTFKVERPHPNSSAKMDQSVSQSGGYKP